MFEAVKQIFKPTKKEPDELTQKIIREAARNRVAAHELENMIKELLDRNSKVSQAMADRGVYHLKDRI